ncbi:MAG: class II aldolase/adducin family protein [Actinobacteria bacterium]|nr:class II aldolase/adducin family protein [Actinomycetota bacterium]
MASVAEGVASVARSLVRLGFISAFGHVSARDGEEVIITSTAPLATATPGSLLCVREGSPSGPGLPLETPLHQAIYRARPDVGAICRCHSPYAVLWGALPAVPPLLHGLGGLAGEVGIHSDPELVCDPTAAAAAATALADGHSLLLAANGSLSVGGDLEEALARAWYFEDRCRVAWEVARPDRPGPPAAGADQRAAHQANELARARKWAGTLIEREP